MSNFMEKDPKLKAVMDRLKQHAEQGYPNVQDPLAENPRAELEKIKRKDRVEKVHGPSFT